MKPKIIIIVGPTAVGKTALGIRIARRYNGEIISGDSQQVYKNLDIGTAKATPEEQKMIYHHLIDIREVTENYSAFDFIKDAEKAITKITLKGKLPIIVGGTGLYIQSLIEGYHLGGNSDQELILSYRKVLNEKSDTELYDMINQEGIIIPELNRRRAIRSLELKKFGRSMKNKAPDYDILLIGLNDDRKHLYERINNRVDQMLERGLLDEAKWLYEKYPNVQASRAIGYKELFPYFSGDQSLTEAVDKLKQNSRRFAKRQLTWFKNRMSVDFFDVSNTIYQEQITKKIDDFFKKH